ncbi:MAG: UvrD-helicase domain-containing protein [Aestuariibacter sp.]
MIEISNEDIDQIESLLNVEFDAQRRQAISSFDDIQACPGSGKTTMVAAKLTILAKKWTQSRQGICVLTHTNVAKNEIIGRLKKSAHGEKLLSNPHFIGTIQEFVNKFLAIPYLRSDGYQINTIDDDICGIKGWHYLNFGTKSYLERKHIFSLHGMEYRFIERELKLNVPGFTQDSGSASYQDLVSVKRRLMESGYFFYGEMYAFAKHYLMCNANIKSAVQTRFPIVLIDEMQDTQRLQDELLNDIFNHENVSLQRFGDPDQAIYSGQEQENQTYNRVELEKVENSHRFDQSIASLAKNISFNRINLCSNIEAPEQTFHTIFLVDENSRSNVLQAFAELCESVLTIDCEKPIKTVGAVGLRKEDGLTLCHYADSYNKGHSTNAFKPNRLIHYFYESSKFEAIHNAYKLLLEGIAKCGQISNSKLTFTDGSEGWYTASNIKKYLKDSGQQIQFNILIKSLIKGEIEQESWDQSVDTIKICLGLNDNVHLTEFLNFDNPVPTESVECAANPNNIVTEVNGRIIKNEVATIHSVKGETHSATLVLETKNHEFDIGKMIGYILGEETNKPTGLRMQRFMKQLYVAFSRPRHLLCLAMDKSRFPVEHVDKTEYHGWKIVDLTT